jgi:propionyl-CoA synthetase
MVETQSIDKYITYADKSANEFVNLKHDTIYKDSIEQQHAFFDAEAKRVHWHKMYTKVIDSSDKYLHRWFPDGEINICYNAVDRHVLKGDGNNVAFFQDSVYTG